MEKRISIWEQFVNKKSFIGSKMKEFDHHFGWTPETVIKDITFNGEYFEITIEKQEIK